MSTWGEFARSEPDLAAAGERLLRGHGGVAFLATTRRDGSPQLHPVMPYIVDGGLYVFVVRMSTKYGDLLRDGRYALHALPGDVNSEEFLVRGPASRIEDAGLAASVAEARGGHIYDFETLFELGVTTCLRTTWERWGQPDTWPSYTRWKAPG